MKSKMSITKRIYFFDNIAYKKVIKKMYWHESLGMAQG